MQIHLYALPLIHPEPEPLITSPDPSPDDLPRKSDPMVSERMRVIVVIAPVPTEGLALMAAPGLVDSMFSNDPNPDLRRHLGFKFCSLLAATKEQREKV